MQNITGKVAGGGLSSELLSMIQYVENAEFDYFKYVIYFISFMQALEFYLDVRQLKVVFI